MKLATLKGLHDENISFTISSLPCTIGRSRAADFIIAHVNVSRNHCEIVKDSSLWKISDYSSSGTYVNDSLVGKGNSVVLSNGDIIRFGPRESKLCWSFQLVQSSDQNCLSEKNLDLNKNTEKEINDLTIAVSKENKVTLPSPDEEECTGKKSTKIIQESKEELHQVQSALDVIEEKDCTTERESSDKKSDFLENITDVLETEFQCTICSELFLTAVTLSCTHTFCKYCIDLWKKKQKTCPICRKKITNETRSLVLDNYIDKMIRNLSFELQERREAIIKERNEPPKKRSKLKTRKS